MGPSKRQWVLIHHRLKTWAAALKHEADLHGRPNSFGVVELAREYGLTARHGYDLGRERLGDLWERLGGRDGWGSCPTYSKGRYYL